LKQWITKHRGDDKNLLPGCYELADALKKKDASWKGLHEELENAIRMQSEIYENCGYISVMILAVNDLSKISYENDEEQRQHALNNFYRYLSIVCHPDFRIGLKDSLKTAILKSPSKHPVALFYKALLADNEADRGSTIKTLSAEDYSYFYETIQSCLPLMHNILKPKKKLVLNKGAKRLIKFSSLFAENGTVETIDQPKVKLLGRFKSTITLFGKQLETDQYPNSKDICQKLEGQLKAL